MRGRKCLRKKDSVFKEAGFTAINFAKSGLSPGYQVLMSQVMLQSCFLLHKRDVFDLKWRY